LNKNINKKKTGKKTDSHQPSDQRVSPDFPFRSGNKKMPIFFLS